MATDSRKKNESSSEMWRRIEQTGIDAALRKLGTCKPDLTIISSISSDDAVNVMGVMVEFAELINCIRLGFEENETEIFDSDEREARYLTTTCPAILELWRLYTTFASDFALNFVQRSWHNSSEHRDLLASVVDLAASSAKLVVVAVNMTSFHSLEDVNNLQTASVRETTTVTTDLEITFDEIFKLGDNHTASNALLELAGWQLHGIVHMSEKVLKVEVESRAPDSSVDDHKELVEATNRLVVKLKQRWGKNEEGENLQEVQPPQPVRKQSNDKNNKNGKKQISKVEPSPPAVETKQPKQECLETLQKLKAVYNDFSNDAWESKRLPVMRGTAGVQLKYRMDSYDQIRKYRVNACAVHNRKDLLESLCLNSDFELHSELFIVEPEGLRSDHDVIMSFPLTSTKPAAGPYSKIFVKVKVNGAWSDLENFEKEKLGDQTMLVFNTKNIEAFTATSFNPRDALIVGADGANYVNDDNGRIELTVPKDCFSSEVTLGIKTLQFDKRGHDTSFMGVVSASPGVELSLESGDAPMSKAVTFQFSLEDGDGDSQRDMELVVVRYNRHSVQVLDRKQFAIKEISDNVYSVDIKDYWCVAILKIRRIYLNMRESIKKEFLIGYGLKVPCNIVTYIDNVSRNGEKQTFAMDVVEKCDVDMAVDVKRGLGLIEVKKSRSKDILLQRGDQVAMVIDGQLRVTEIMPEGQNVLSFIKGGRNMVFIQTEIKRDPEKLPDAMIFYQLLPEDTVLHSVAMMTRDLSEVTSDSIVARTGLHMKMSDHKQEKQKDEAAVQILKMESLMSLARELTFEEGTSLGQQLGVTPATMKRIAQEVEKDRVAANFQILCYWRGRCARATMADFLVSCLKAVGKMNYADLVMEVRTHNRGLERSDFIRMKSQHGGKVY